MEITKGKYEQDYYILLNMTDAPIRPYWIKWTGSGMATGGFMTPAEARKHADDVVERVKAQPELDASRL